MAQRRARTADRDRAVEVINDAYAEGQLSYAEHATRVTKALKARTLAQLNGLTLDLQQPPTPAVAPEQPATTPTYREQFRKNAAAQREEWRRVPRWKKILIGGLFATCIGGVGAIAVFDDGTDTPGSSVTDGAGTLALTAEGIDKFLGTYEKKFDTTHVVSATFATNNIVLKVPTEDGKARHVEWRYRSGEFKQVADARRNSPEQAPIDLADIDLAKLEENIAQAKASLNIEAPNSILVWVEREFRERRPSVRIQVGNKFLEHGMLITDLAGTTEIERSPFVAPKAP